MVPIRGGVAAARSSSSAGAATAAGCISFTSSALPSLPHRRRSTCARAASVASSEPPSTSSDGGNGNGTITDDPNFRCNGLQVDRNKEIYGRERVSAATLAVHGGEREGRPRVSDSLTTPIVQVRLLTAVGGGGLKGRERVAKRGR